jgi:hypothetical protein
MDLINRYVYAVLRHVPATQRADIEKEIRAMIDELLLENKRKRQASGGAQSGVAPDETEVKAVLAELGNPANLARQYMGHAKYVIGPALSETYWLVVRIVLIAVGIGLTVAQTIQLISGTYDQIWTAIGGFIGGLYQGLLAAFAMVTLVFILIEHFAQDSVAAEIEKEVEKWRPDDLPQVPDDKLIIKRSDPIVNIIFTLIFLAIINISPELFGFFAQTDSGLQITGFLGSGFFAMLLWINLVCVFGLVLEAFKIIYARWTWLLVLFSMLQNLVSFLVGLRVVRHPDFINPDFIEAVNVFLRNHDLEAAYAWQNPLVVGLTVVIAVGFAAEMMKLTVKGVRLLQTRK